jgi:serine/threonine-protein kinase
MTSGSPSPAPGRNLNERASQAFAQRGYKLLGELGRGGMGVVYLAEHTKLMRRVAIKTLTPERMSKENSVLRFQREARTFAQIRHPHIAQLYEFEDSGPIIFLALEYIDGTDLERERRKNRRWTPEEIAVMIRDTADALDHTHKKGILHRDIKPGNILIEKDTNRAVLTDFGLAKGETDEALTQQGFAVGTPAYMAPEQITDQFGGKPDGRADLFSLATVAYEMMTGKHPFLAADDLNTMRNIVNGRLTPIRDLNPDMPQSLCTIIEAALQKNPKDRPADAATFAAQLNDWLTNRRNPARTTAPQAPAQPVAPISAPAPAPAAPPPAPPAPAGGLSPKTIALLIAVAIVVLLLGIGLGVMLSRGGG